MPRVDISDWLIHWIQGGTRDAAFETLDTIIKERQLKCGTGMIKGSFCCVCFSEAPMLCLPGGLVNQGAFSRYQPFGIMVQKRWLFGLGGRPVIYQPEREYYDLPEDLRWRHVLYELRDGMENVDFTWEREWRIRTDCVRLDQSDASIVVPDPSWSEALTSRYERREDFNVYYYSTMMTQSQAEMWREPFKWTVYCLERLTSD